MTEEKWLDTVGKIKDKFQVLEEGRQKVPEIPRAFVDFIVFDGPQGRFRLERKTQPVVLDKKTMYSKTAGQASKVEYIYSETENFSKLRVYSWDEGAQEWQEMKTSGGMFAA